MKGCITMNIGMITGLLLLGEGGVGLMVRDGKRSAQFEETLLVTETGVEVLTKKLD